MKDTRLTELRRASISASGQSRRLSDVRAMSASPPAPDVSLRRSEPTWWANTGNRTSLRGQLSRRHRTWSCAVLSKTALL